MADDKPTVSQADIDRWASEARAGGIPDACNRYVGMTPALYESYATGHAKRAEARPFAAAEESGGEVTRPHRSEAELRQRRIEQEAERRWRDWRGPGRPRLTTFEKQVRDEFAAKARKDGVRMSKAGKKEQALRAARDGQVVAEPAGNASEGEAVEQSAAQQPVEKEKAVKTKRKAHKPVHNGHGNGNGSGKSKRDKIIELARRKHGCTLAEVLSVTGWPSVSMPQVAKAARVKLRKEKAKGEVTHYFVAA